MRVRKRLQLGVCLPTWQDEQGTTVRWREIRELGLLAEEAGIDTVWVPDHLLRRGANSTIGFWECWTLLSALAEATSRVTLGPFMACAGFRNPALLAKMADTLDEVSGGRVILGLGAGLPENDTSWRTFGYPTDHVASRYEEALQIVSRLLKEGTVTFQGQYHTVNDAEILPRGPRPQGPPVWVAAKGPRLIKAAARWGDALNLNVICTGVESIREPFDMLEEACREVGRDPSSIARTGYTFITFAGPGADMSGARAKALRGSPEEIAAQLNALHGAGMEHITLYIDTGEHERALSSYPLLNAKAIELIAPLTQALRKLEAGG